MKPDHVSIVVCTRIIPIMAAGFETYPELDVAEILALCQPALEVALREEFIAR